MTDPQRDAGERGRTEGLTERIRTALARLQTARHGFIVVAAALIGVAGGGAAILFRYLIEGTTWAFSGGETLAPSGFADLPWFWLMLMPAAGGLIVGQIVHWLAPEVKGTGVPEVMEAVALHGGHVRKRVAPFKALAVAVCLGSGGSAGREGPIVHVGAAIGSLVGRMFSVPVGQVRTFVGCGAAAGIAATFNAPIAGAMFAGEVILGQFGVVSFSAIVIASVVATVLSRHFIGDFPAFVVPAFQMHHNYELVFYAAIGLAAAGLGCLFIWGLQRLRHLFDALPGPAWLKPAVGGLLLGGLGAALPGVLGVGYGAINEAMHGSMPWLLMLALLGAKLAATSLTLGSGGSGGIFAPSLFLGAMLGGVGGTALAAVAPHEVGSTGSYALVAMGAMVAATTRAPITAIIIIFEMTNNYTIILPLMIACILATLVAGQIVNPSIYHAKLLSKGIDLTVEQSANVLRHVPVGAVHYESSTSVREDAPLEELLTVAAERGDLHCIVVDSDGRYVGMIHFPELRHVYFNEQDLSGLVLAADLVHRDVPTLLPGDSLDLALKLLGETGFDTLPVLDTEDRTRVKGVITRDAVIETYNRELLRRDPAGEAAGLMVTAERARSVEIGERTVLLEMEAPSHFTGKRLKELDLRRRYDVQVMLVRRRVGDGSGARIEREIPGPEFELQRGDLLLLLGTPEGLKRMHAL